MLNKAPLITWLQVERLDAADPGCVPDTTWMVVHSLSHPCNLCTL